MTRVLHVLDHSLPLHSGYTFRTRAILKAQQALGLEVRGITGQRHNVGPGSDGGRTDPEEADGLAFHRTPGTPSGPPVLAEISEVRALAAAIRRPRARNGGPTCSTPIRPRLAARRPCLRGARSACRWSTRSAPSGRMRRSATGRAREGSAKYRATRALETQVAKRADALFTICGGLRSDLVARGIPEGRIGVMPNGVDLSLFGEPVARDDALAGELGIAGDAAVIGYIGSFYAYEGVDDLIAAMPLLRERHPGARLLLVGGGEMDGEWRAAAARLPEPGAVIFTGRVPHGEVERYYSLIDVLAYPRKKQRLTDLVTPLKPLEAMAQRRLVAASDVGGHRELITDGATGTLFAPDDPAACAAALADLVDRRTDWDAQRERAARHVRARHDWQANARNYLGVYQALLAKRGRAGSATLSLEGNGAR